MAPLARLATVEQAGDALADLARRDDVMRMLWRESARMTGLPRT